MTAMTATTVKTDKPDRPDPRTPINVYIYNELAGAHPTWTLAVHAVNMVDARDYVKAVHRGGKYVTGYPEGTPHTANCGATTERARLVLHERYNPDTDAPAY